MMRGAIDFSDGFRIGGWLYSPEIPVQNRLLHAFVDGTCVGSGRVDQFRQDIADVGLGDGQCGFNFAITLAQTDDLRRVHVRFDHSDLSLLQPGALIIDSRHSPPVRAVHTADTIDWMRDRGWIDEPDAAFLRDMSNGGGHAWSLRERAPEAEAKRLLALYHRADVRVQVALIRLENLADERRRLVAGAALSMIAIHAPAGEIVVHPSSNDRSSHLACGEDRLIFIDTQAALNGTSGQTARVYRALVAERTTSCPVSATPAVARWGD